LVKSRQWIEGEPTLREILSDPIVHLVMQRDGVTAAEVRRTVLTAQIGMLNARSKELSVRQKLRARAEANAA